tara:strand:- start:6997 stop:8022 length:1026 start_codon:yes stop_codon:yes gene_type:complete
MKNILPYLTALAALVLAGSAAFYSVFGLSKFYAGAATAVIIMGIAIEASKLIATSVLHQYHKILSLPIKLYLSFAILVSMTITSAGIYGFLISAYQETAFKMDIEDQVIGAEKNRLIVFEQELKNLDSERNMLSDNISKANTNILKLSEGLSNNVVQYTNADGNVITTQSSSTRRILKEQLQTQSDYRDTLVVKRDKLAVNIKTANDSINTINIRVLQLKTNSDIAGEIGPLKYLSELTGVSMNRVVNWFTILLIIIFDPLAVALVVVLNNIMKSRQTAENVSKPDVEQEAESKAESVKATTSPVLLKDDTIDTPAPETKEDIYEEKEEEDKPKRRNAYWT